MNNIDSMPPKCNGCSYWQVAEEPYVCWKCMDSVGDLEEKDMKESDKSILNDFTELIREDAKNQNRKTESLMKESADIIDKLVDNSTNQSDSTENVNRSSQCYMLGMMDGYRLGMGEAIRVMKEVIMGGSTKDEH